MAGFGTTPHDADRSVRKVAALRLAPQYAVTSTSFSSHCATHVVVMQFDRRMRTLAAGPDAPWDPAGPAGPGGPAGPRSPGGPGGPCGPGCPWGPAGPCPQPAINRANDSAASSLGSVMKNPVRNLSCGGTPVAFGNLAACPQRQTLRKGPAGTYMRQGRMTCGCMRGTDATVCHDQARPTRLCA